ncbi:MAG: amidase family protein, partial [Gammaproteobacteria bacterium]|nr:amidase family protein [Gammaproteobacteria bacterium]
MHELCLLSATEMLGLLRKGDISCSELLEAHIAQIDRFNPQINAIVTMTFEDAREKAKQLDMKPHRQAPLFGLPIAHKDLLPTKGVRTTFGFPLYRDFVPQNDAWIVARMKAAGAISIGKTNVPEFGAGSHTFNRVFGATKNPYDRTRTVGGSSGGAAAALCSRMVPLADGSDTGGSLRNPAAFCNVVGFRPSPGRIPSGPNGESWTDLSQLGPLARTIDDTALLFSVLSGPHPKASRMLETPGQAFRIVEPAQLQGLKIAFTEDFGCLPVERPIRETLRRFVARLEQEGAIVETASPNLKEARWVFGVLRSIGFRRRFLDFLTDKRSELKDTIQWEIERGKSLTLDDVERAFQKRSKIIQDALNFFQDYDVLLGPSTQVMQFPIEVDWVREVEGKKMSNYIEWMEACSLISTIGFPSLSL